MTPRAEWLSTTTSAESQPPLAGWPSMQACALQVVFSRCEGESASIQAVQRHANARRVRALIPAGQPDPRDYDEPQLEDYVALAELVSLGRAGVVLPATIAATGGKPQNQRRARARAECSHLQPPICQLPGGGVCPAQQYERPTGRDGWMRCDRESEAN